MKLLILWLLAAAPTHRGTLIFRGSPPQPTEVKGVTAIDYFPADAGFELRLSRLAASSAAELAIDPAHPALALVTQGEAVVSGAKAAVLAGAARRCGDSLRLERGAALLVAQDSGGGGPLVGRPLKEKCQPHSPRLERLVPDPREDFELPVGRAKFLGHAPFAYLGRLTLNAGAEVKPHQHPDSTELLWLERGEGVVTIDGVADRVSAGDVIRIPKGKVHSFTARAEAVKAVQLYLPPGPEQRFRHRPDAGAPRP